MANRVARNRLVRGRPGLGRFLTGYLVIGGSLIALGSFIYAQSLLRQMAVGPRTISRIYAQFCARATLPAATSQSQETEIIFREVVRTIKFPVVFTDPHGVPRAWRNVGVDPAVISYEELAHVDPENPPSGPIAKLVRTVESLDRQYPPIPLTYGDAGQVLGYVHYGDLPAVRALRWIPMIQVLVVLLFVVIGLAWFRTVRRSEESFIWAGMAKETAHQLGTPLSSLLGWVELLKSQRQPSPDVVSGMERDLDRLLAATSRFSKIGSAPTLEVRDPTELLTGVVEYFRSRLPRLSQSVQLTEDYQDPVTVRVDQELFSWAIENLIRNALDAIKSKGGQIQVSTRVSINRRQLEIRVSDTGRGISKSDRAKIFNPGYTTKNFGWGLGLPLARRIVEQYHGGRLMLEESQPGEGSTFLITLPIYR
jgi:NtrC-family two-component system sensor histidine kinase KinB